MSTKNDIQQMLIAMGFDLNYIKRAFKVYEKNYGHGYNVEVITEIIARLQRKDNDKQNAPNLVQKASKPKTESIFTGSQYNKHSNHKKNYDKNGNITHYSHKQNSHSSQSISGASPSMFKPHDIVTYQGQDAEVMRIVSPYHIEITYPTSAYMMQRWKCTVSPQQIQRKIRKHKLYYPYYYAPLISENEEQNKSIPSKDISATKISPISSFRSFRQHLSLSEAHELQVNDKVDHRDEVGRFVYGTVVEKQGAALKIHYDGWSRKWDSWSNYRNQLNRFANPGSISKRPAHRFVYLKKGDYIDIYPTQRHPGWRCGEIRRLDQKSGQVQVVYESEDKNYLYWAHLDDIMEIAEFTSKSGTVHSTQIEILKSRQRKFPKGGNEEINNPYNINDKLYVQDSRNMNWWEATVIDKENNWIILHLDGYDSKYDQQWHVIREAARLSDIWYKEMSFHILKNKGLIHCYNEWKSVKNTFIMNTQYAMEWMNRQKTPFRVSKLSYLLISGYTKCKCMNNMIPLDIQRIIISFCNFMFVKLMYDMNGNKSEYRAFDTNIMIRDLAKMIEIEEKLDMDHTDCIYSDYVHIWSRFGLIKDIYPIKTDRICIKWNSMQNEDNEGWVEIPDDYTELSLMQLDHAMEYDDTLEIGIDINIKSSIKWSFNPKNIGYNMSISEISEWIFSLKIGDIIDVYNNHKKIWLTAMIRNITNSSFYIHYIGYNVKYDEIIDVTNTVNLSRLNERYSHCLLPPHRHKKLKKEKVNKLTFCWRTDGNQ